jgi:ABC-type lipoprotein release transport system permease subunit
MVELFLALRYLCKRRIAFCGTAAVALCVALLIVVTSLFNGFLKAVDDSWKQQYGDIVFAPREKLADFVGLAEYLEKLDGVDEVAIRVATGGLLYLGRGDVKAVEFRGIDLKRSCRNKAFREGLLLQGGGEAASFELSEKARQGYFDWLGGKLNRKVDDKMPPAPGIIPGIGILAKPSEVTDEYDKDAVAGAIGQRAEPMFIIAGKYNPEDGSDDATSIRTQKKACWPVDAIQTGVYQADTECVYVPLWFLQELIGSVGADGQGRCYGQLFVKINSSADIEDVKMQLGQRWQMYAVEKLNYPAEGVPAAEIFSARDMSNMQLFTREIRKQLAVLELIIGLICLVVALLIFVILIMMVMQKRKDIGIIRAIGFSRRAVAGLYLWYGGGIGVTGAMVGLLLGVLATRNINIIEAGLTKLFGFKIWKSGVYMFSHIPNDVDWGSVAWILPVGLVTAMLGALLPAFRAGRMLPAETLRYE